MIVARSRGELERGLASLRGRGERIGFVPTMGYLHEGHLSLVDLAHTSATHVVASVFVNPLQFGPDEDLDRYPRDRDRDLTLLEGRGVDLAFLPGESDIYPEGAPAVTVDPGPLGGRLCGAYRPGFFRGVLTVVAKLFGLVRPEVAVFGRKDFQQLVLVRRMVRDLELGVEVVGAPIVREPDGLAMSSRNSYLSEEERGQAPALLRGLDAAVHRFRSGTRDAAALIEAVRTEVSAQPLLGLQYADVVDPSSLTPVDPVASGAVVAVAAHCGDTRLIDNVVLEPA